MTALSTPGGIVPSADLFSTIEAEVGPAAQSVVIIEPNACPPGIPAKALTVALGREIVHNPELPDSLRDTIWTTLVRTAMTQPKPWQRIAIWTALPGLRAITNRLYRVWHTDLQDLRSEVVLGFLEALRQADPDQPHLGSRLWWNTYRLARQMCRQAMFERATDDIDLLVSRRAEVGQPVSSAAGPVDADSDPRAVESARLGSLAARLGLRVVINRHSSAGGVGRVIFLPKNRTTRPAGALNTRGNASGEAA